MTPYNIKSHQKQGFSLSLENTVLEQPQGVKGGQIDPLSPAFLGLKRTKMLSFNIYKKFCSTPVGRSSGVWFLYKIYLEKSSSVLGVE